MASGTGSETTSIPDNETFLISLLRVSVFINSELYAIRYEKIFIHCLVDVARKFRRVAVSI